MKGVSHLFIFQFYVTMHPSRPSHGLINENMVKRVKCGIMHNEVVKRDRHMSLNWVRFDTSAQVDKKKS